jgi:tetratricopeptide (TPR) repeat protein
MTDAQKTVFISYRRSSSSFIARAVFQDLRANGFDAFLDIETIDSGAFDSIILHQIAARAHFVLILSPGALERCAQPDDWLRREIETAMDLGRNIVPLMVGDFTFAGSEAYLTGKLEALPRFNAVKVFHEYFDEAMARLRDRYLKPPQIPVIKPTPADEQAAVTQKISEAAAQLAVTLNQVKAEGLLWQAQMRDKGDHEGRLEDTNAALALYPEYADAYLLRGNAHARMNNVEQAMVDYTESIRLDPESPKGYFNRGNLRYEGGDLEGSLSDYALAFERTPEEISDETLRYVRVQYMVALCERAAHHLIEGDARQSLNVYRKANDVMPAANMALVGIAVSRYALGHVEEAIRLWKYLVTYNEKFKDLDWVRDIYQLPERHLEEARKILARIFP